MTVGLVLVHGRSQQTPAAVRSDATQVASHIDGIKRRWLAGLAKGTILAGHQPLDETTTPVFTAFYGDVLVDQIDAHLASGGPTPDLESATGATVRDLLILETAEVLGFDPSLHMEASLPTGPAEQALRAHREGLELRWTSALSATVVHSAISFIARKTAAAELVIEQFLTDVAFYLDTPVIRAAVLDTVHKVLDEASDECDAIVVIGHSLGSVVAYDVLQERRDRCSTVALLVTAGSPLGLPVVQRNLLPKGHRGPWTLPRRNGQIVPWLNAFDVRDPVALINPLLGLYDGEIRDERTANSSDPHSIEDYLSDPDVARPIASAVTGHAPW